MTLSSQRLRKIVGPSSNKSPPRPAVHLPLFRSGLSVPFQVPKYRRNLLALSLLTSEMSISQRWGPMLGPLRPVDSKQPRLSPFIRPLRCLDPSLREQVDATPFATAARGRG